jgi:hypothetical protein
VDERDFWIQVRRWLKGQIAADQQMVEAIERRFGPFGEQKRRQEDRPPPPAA